MARIAQLRQDYSILLKEAARRHSELQQRRFSGALTALAARRTAASAYATMPPPLTGGLPMSSSAGAKVELPTSSPEAAPLPQLGASAPQPGDAAGSATEPGPHAADSVQPKAYLRTL